MGKRLKGLVAAALSVLLVVLAGCQSIGGMDFNQVIQQNMKAKSYEGKASYRIELTTDPVLKMSAEQKRWVSILKDVTLRFDNLRYQDAANYSAEGALIYKNGTIPFAAYINEGEAVFRVEGASKPVAVAMPETETGLPSTLFPGTGKIGDLEERIVEDLAPFVIKQLPNPQALEVTPGQQITINGETVTAHKVQARIVGSEVAGLVKTFLQNAVADEQGLKDFLKKFYVLSEGKEVDAEAVKEIDAMYKELKLGLPLVLAQIEQQLTTDEAKSVLNDKSTLDVSLYVDGNGWIRKSEAVLNLALPSDETNGIRGIKLTASSDLWNMNGKVTPSQVDASGALVVDDSFKPAHFLKTLDSGSTVYRLLMKDLRVTHRELTYYVTEEADPFFSVVYVKNGVSMAPTKMISEELGADVAWNGAKQQVTITDIMTGKMIVLTVGSRTAYVDGKEVQLPAAPVNIEGRNYVPLKFIVLTLGGQVQWDGEEYRVLVQKD